MTFSNKMHIGIPSIRMSLFVLNLGRSEANLQLQMSVPHSKPAYLNVSKRGCRPLQIAGIPSHDDVEITRLKSVDDPMFITETNRLDGSSSSSWGKILKLADRMTFVRYFTIQVCWLKPLFPPSEAGRFALKKVHCSVVFYKWWGGGRMTITKQRNLPVETVNNLGIMMHHCLMRKQNISGKSANQAWIFSLTSSSCFNFNSNLSYY